MALPTLAEAHIRMLLPGVDLIGAPLAGGQKLVFPCHMADSRFALKVMLTNPSAPQGSPEDYSVEVFDEATARAAREMSIIAECVSPHLVKPGPIPPGRAEINGERVIYFSEEWIDGRDLGTIILTDGPLPLAQIKSLGVGITEAVKELWSKKKIHRDVKPANIMRRDGSSTFVLLDMGIAFDIEDVSLTAPGVIVGTMIYYSPEQIEFVRKRQMDFRSDLFSLGIVMYEAAAGRHPFWSTGMTSQQAVGHMLQVDPDPPAVHRVDIDQQLNTIIMRLLKKQPHLRYRTCDDLLAALAAV